MMDNIINKHPFNLDEGQSKWVKETFDNLDQEEKIGQLFLLVCGMDPAQDVGALIDEFKPGGFMYRPMPKEEILAAHKMIQEKSKIPAFLAANTEAGGNGLIADVGTEIGNNMQVAATNDPDYGYKQGLVAGAELVAAGGNMSFAPVIDINYEFKNPIANTRAYSDEVEKVRAFGVNNVKGTQEMGAAVTVKHFPGDGIDSRDQHITTTMNHLNLEDWLNSYGSVYKSTFEAGALGIMVGHFFVPNIMDDMGAKEDKWIPTSYNKTVLGPLLREKLGFNGLVLTDATQMAGMVGVTARSKMVPLTIQNGADVFLFTRNTAEDYQSIRDGLKNGLLTQERLDEAVIRILATKAKLNLHVNDNTGGERLAEIGSEKHLQWQKEVAEKSITLLRNEQNMFPLKDIKRVKLLTFIPPSMFGPEQATEKIVKKFADEGVEAVLFDYASNPMLGMVDAQKSEKELKEEFDAVFYVSAIQPTSNSATLQVVWKAMVGMDAPNTVATLPTAWISLGNPYHLFDAPMVRNFINCYSSSNATIDALFEKMFGRQEFTGVSPVKADVRYPNYRKELDIVYDY